MQWGFAMARKFWPVVLAASVVVLGSAIATAFAAEYGRALPESYQRLLVPIKKHKDKTCCKACIKIGKHKQCGTFCGEGSEDRCDAFKHGNSGGDHGKNDGGSPGKSEPEKKSEPKLEDQPCFPICRDKCIATRTDMTFDQCVIDCLERTRCSD